METELKTLFDKSLSDLISNSNDEQSSQKLMANFSAATSKKKENGNSSRQAVHALLLKKIDVGRYLNGFAYPPMITSAVPVTGVKTSDGSDPIDKLGKLFEPFASLLNSSYTIFKRLVVGLVFSLLFTGNRSSTLTPGTMPPLYSKINKDRGRIKPSAATNSAYDRRPELPEKKRNRQQPVAPRRPAPRVEHDFSPE